MFRAHTFQKTQLLYMGHIILFRSDLIPQTLRDVTCNLDIAVIIHAVLCDGNCIAYMCISYSNSDMSILIFLNKIHIPLFVQ